MTILLHRSQCDNFSFKNVDQSITTHENEICHQRSCKWLGPYFDKMYNFLRYLVMFKQYSKYIVVVMGRTLERLARPGLRSSEVINHYFWVIVSQTTRSKFEVKTLTIILCIASHRSRNDWHFYLQKIGI